MARINRSNRILGLLWIGIFILIMIASISVKSQSLTELPANPTYFGYTVSTSVKTLLLSSNVNELDGLIVESEGGAVGVVLANRKGKLRSNVGLFYSSDAAKYTVDLLEASISGSIYLLRLNRIESHAIEPYALVGLTTQQNTFRGLSSERAKNHSITYEEICNRLRSVQMSTGIGIEYQLENDTLDFIHFFAEARIGKILAQNSTDPLFSNTHARRPMTLTVGVSFGKFW